MPIRCLDRFRDQFIALYSFKKQSRTVLRHLFSVHLIIKYHCFDKNRKTHKANNACQGKKINTIAITKNIYTENLEGLSPGQTFPSGIINTIK